MFVSLATRFDILFLVYDGKITAKNLIAKLVFPKLKGKIPIAYKGNPTYFAYILYIIKAAPILTGTARMLDYFNRSATPRGAWLVISPFFFSYLFRKSSSAKSMMSDIGMDLFSDNILTLSMLL